MAHNNSVPRGDREDGPCDRENVVLFITGARLQSELNGGDVLWLKPCSGPAAGSKAVKITRFEKVVGKTSQYESPFKDANLAAKAAQTLLDQGESVIVEKEPQGITLHTLGGDEVGVTTTITRKQLDLFAS